MSRRRRGYEHRRGNTVLPFVQLFIWMMRSSAWRDLDSVSRDAYLELKSHFNGENNGTIGLSVRQLGEAIGVSAATASRALKKLVEHGFIVPTSKGTVGTGSGNRLAAEWLLTEHRDNRTGKAATKDFMCWQKAEASAKRQSILTVAKGAKDVSSVQHRGNQIPQDAPPRFTIATSEPILASSTLHGRNTLTSSHGQGAARASVVAPHPMGRVNEAGQAGDFNHIAKFLPSLDSCRKPLETTSDRKAN